jgi:hypothetical protein
MALLAGALPTIASAQPARGQPGYDPQDAPPSGCDRPPPPRVHTNTMPNYHEEPMPSPPPSGGYHDSYGTADVEADQRAATAPTALSGPGKRDPHYARVHYAAKIARWRARAAACEAGDLAACQGAEE